MTFLPNMKRYTPILLIILFLSFLWSCETTDPLVNEVQISLFTGDYETALETVNNAIEINPDNYIAHYYKGVVLSSQAYEMEPASARKDVYAQARESLERARELMVAQEETPDELEELNETIVSYWADEYNMAVNYQNDDSLFNATPEPYQVSLDHLENAVTINPDSAMTYQVISSTHFQLNNVDQAITTYETAMDMLEEPAESDYEYLISLYLYDNRYDKAIDLSEEALDNYEGNSVFVQFLADAYIQSGERDKAIELVEGLIREEPDNPQYRRVLGTQVYQSVEALTSELSDLYEELFELRRQASSQSGNAQESTQAQLQQLETEIDRREAEIDELTDISIREMEEVVRMEPESEDANFILGIIYQNRAANLFERRNNTNDNAESNRYDAMAREVLDEARTYYERAAEINPDNPDNWQSLFQVYTILNMEEEAEEAMRRAGFDN
ncbi:MAG TPA: tetratricopeptide repeat protein [Balneolaceae bacterium]|nr:tetratricopeptide repeat protein [Balneolaceae bacterium]